MNRAGTSLECGICGGTDFYKESGNFFCNGCQTQTQEIQEHVFSQDEHTINKKATKKINEQKNDKNDEKLTSWECYNVIMKGLTNELIQLGAKADLREVVKYLWMKYLEKCEVFDIKRDQLPKVSLIGSKKDIDILYNRKRTKRKRRISNTSSRSSLSIRRKRSHKKRALVHTNYDDISLSQSLTQNTSIANESLSTVSDTELSEGKPTKIVYNKPSTKEMKKFMTNNHRKRHCLDTMGVLTCHKFRLIDMSRKFNKRPSSLTNYSLYCLLYLGLLIIKDSIQLSDLLRFIKEGHLSFGNYRHFFDKNLKVEMLNLPATKQQVFSNQTFRYKAAQIADFLGISHYINKPDLKALCARYCKELNLPTDVQFYAEKLIVESKPFKWSLRKNKEIPNYEDGETENQLSLYAKELNAIELDLKMFDFIEWIKFIRCRDMVVRKYHLISSMDVTNKISGSDYVNYFMNQELAFTPDNRHWVKQIKDYHQVLSNVRTDCRSEQKYEATLTPFRTYSEVILKKQKLPCQYLLEKKFEDDSLEFLMKPLKYLTLLDVQCVKHGGARDDFIIEPFLHRHFNTFYVWKRNSCTAPVKIVENSAGDKNVQEYLNTFRKKSIQTTDIEILLDNWQKGNDKQFKSNLKLLQKCSSTVNLTNRKRASPKLYKQHFITFERYWLNISSNPTRTQFSKADMNNIMSNTPTSLKTILNECARIGEQTLSEFYREFLLTELGLIYCVKLGKAKIQKNTHTAVLKGVLRSTHHKW